MLCAIWGSTWLAIKIGLEGAPAFLAASLRFVVAASALLGLAIVLKSRLPRGRTEWSVIVFVGIVLFTADYGLIYWGENNGVESGLSAVLFATMPLQTAIAAHALLAKERLTLQKVTGIVLGFGGVLLIFRGQLGAAGMGRSLPMIAIVLSASCAAVSTVAMKRWAHDIDPVAFNSFAMGTGAIVLAIVSLGAGEVWSVPAWPEGILAIVYLALAGSVVTFVTYTWLLKTVDATSMSFVSLITPIVAIFLGFSIGNEPVEPLDLVGSAITLAGIYLGTSKRVASWASTAVRAESAPAENSPDGPVDEER